MKLRFKTILYLEVCASDPGNQMNGFLKIVYFYEILLLKLA